MSKFLDELKDSVLSCDMEEKLPHRWVDNHEMVGSTIDMIDSLGENARRMLEIGVVQDELVKLGFELFNHNGYGADIDKMRLFGTARFEIVFHPTSVFLYHIPSLNEKQVKDTKLDISYNSTTWQEDLINRVKELIK